jgi:hypothetical protein
LTVYIRLATYLFPLDSVLEFNNSIHIHLPVPVNCLNGAFDKQLARAFWPLKLQYMGPVAQSV